MKDAIRIVVIFCMIWGVFLTYRIIPNRIKLDNLRIEVLELQKVKLKLEIEQIKTRLE